MKNTVVSFLAGGIFFSIIILSTAVQQVNVPVSETEVIHQGNYHNRYYELEDQLRKMEVDFAKFYRKPKRSVGNRLHHKLDQLNYLTEEIQKEIYQLQEKRKPLFGKK